jgi:hypothetical protein
MMGTALQVEVMRFLPSYGNVALEEEGDRKYVDVSGVAFDDSLQLEDRKKHFLCDGSLLHRGLGHSEYDVPLEIHYCYSREPQIVPHQPMRRPCWRKVCGVLTVNVRTEGRSSLWNCRNLYEIVVIVPSNQFQNL